MGGKETVNSGAKNQDNDFRIDLITPICWGTWNKVSGESKFTTNKQFPLKLEVMKRTIKESNHNLPVLHIGFVEGVETSEFILLRAEDFKSILDYIWHLQTVIIDKKVIYEI